MFSLILSICISSGSIATCEKQELYKALTKEQCLVKMGNVLRDIEVSPFYAFEWELSCTKETTDKENGND